MPDEHQLRAIYDQYRDPLFRFAYRLTSSPAAAEDLVHDCFLGLFRGGFDQRKGSLRTYLYAAVRNLSRKRFRNLGREGFLDDVDAPGGDAGPLEILLERESADGVRMAIEGLPVLQREVLILAEYEEMPLEEIARIIDADLSAVKSRLHRARERLKKSLLRCEA
jgi:RNA polymerase sigma-70 factor (ECF subfamily)